MVTRGQFLESGSGRIAYRVADDLAEKRAIEVADRAYKSLIDSQHQRDRPAGHAGNDVRSPHHHST